MKYRDDSKDINKRNYDNTPKRQVRMMVHGQVQCVGFRYYTLTEANQLGIKGWVKNNYDGTVEIEAEGLPEAMAEFIERVRKGPRFSTVTAIDITELDGHKMYYDFDVRD